MNKKSNFFICTFVIIGAYLLLTGGCKEDDTPATIEVIPLTMVDIPAGTFTMGSPAMEVKRGADEIQHQVTLSAFKMSKYEITNAQYAEFLNAKGIGTDGLYAAGAYPTQKLIAAGDWGLIYSAGKWIPTKGNDNFPVIYITWYGATMYATDAGGRLPTESEWEYACRAGTTTPFSTGECLSNEQANYTWSHPYQTCANADTNFLAATQAVAAYPTNPWGLHDMHGNVWEWCSDFYGVYSPDDQTNPTGPATGSKRVIRGGGWPSYARYCRSAVRYSETPTYIKSFGIGFRIVKTL